MIDARMSTRNTLRLLGGIVAAAMMMAGAGGISLTTPAVASESMELKAADWSFAGPFGTYDRNALRRGYQVYKEVCSACHSMDLVHFRNLADDGGPEFSEAEVKALAAEYTVMDGPNDEGDMFERPGEPRDALVAPFANEQAARVANGGALPPDLSLIVKARPDGANYVYSLLTSYEEPPAGFEMAQGMNYNLYFANQQTAMAPPISDDIVEYADGTPATTEQIAKDVVTFLMWAAEPKLEERHRIGFMSMIYLIVLAGLLYFATRKVWSDQH